MKQVKHLVEGSFGFNLEVVASSHNGSATLIDGSGCARGPVFGSVN